MSDWEDFCDANGWSIGSEDDYDDFIDSLDSDDEFEPQPLIFKTFDESKEWGKRNPGKAIVRNPNGEGFVPKELLIKENNIFLGMDLAQANLNFSEALEKLSPYLRKAQISADLDLQDDEFKKDLHQLRKHDVEELIKIIQDKVEVEKRDLIISSNNNRDGFAIPEDEAWIACLQKAIKLCYRSLNR